MLASRSPLFCPIPPQPVRVREPSTTARRIVATSLPLVFVAVFPPAVLDVHRSAVRRLTPPDVPLRTGSLWAPYHYTMRVLTPLLTPLSAQHAETASNRWQRKQL